MDSRKPHMMALQVDFGWGYGKPLMPGLLVDNLLVDAWGAHNPSLCSIEVSRGHVGDRAEVNVWNRQQGGEWVRGSDGSAFQDMVSGVENRCSGSVVRNTAINSRWLVGQRIWGERRALLFL